VTLVLVTEDEAVLRLSAEEMLEEGGYETVSAGSVADAIATLEKRPEIDVLFTDIGLVNEREGGLALARNARRFRPALLVLYTTAGILTDKMTTEFVADSRFLAKPYTCGEVHQALTRLLNGSNEADGSRRSGSAEGGSEQAGPGAAGL
jgi:CheY-like chemotaxis protein